MENECEACKVSCAIDSKDETTNTRYAGIVLYSTNCPRCAVLEKKLTQHGIEFKKNTMINEMVVLGIKQAPMLLVNGELLDFSEANVWLNNLKQEEDA